MIGSNLITVSRLKSWRKCARLHRFQYVDGFRPAVDAAPLRFGTLFHVGLETWWKTGDLSVAIAEIEKAAKDADDPTLVIRAKALMNEYPGRQWADRERFEVLAVEAPFECDLINPDSMRSSQTYRLAGKIDLVLRDRETGEAILVEHKTTTDDISDDGAHYFKKLAMDSQLSIYVVGAESLGFPVTRIIYDVAARPELELRKATPVEDRKYTKPTKTEPSRLYSGQREFDETLNEYSARVVEDLAKRPARYFRRVDQVRLDDEIRDGLLDTWMDARIIREAELANRAPRNSDACTQFGTCAFYDVCAYGVDPNYSTKFKRVERIHQELANA